ncbi:MAG TPA: GAF domain-containing protein [Candidatus Limnocylindrales bacterium]|nr:GAF domain-containing protein [Candidatus Limnocylindrales bacterium]
MDGHGLSAAELARLKRRKPARPVSAFQAAVANWRPSRSIPERVRDAAIALKGDLVRLHHSLPGLLDEEFLFALALWVAVFLAAVVIVSTGTVPLGVRYAVGVTALVYLYLYAELARIRRPLPLRALVMTVSDAGVAITIYLLAAPYVTYGEMLLFFAAARMVERFKDLRAIPLGLLILLPIGWRHAGSPVELVLEGFGVLVLMLGIEHLLGLAARLRQEAAHQGTMATLSSAIARAADPEALLGQLISLAPPLRPQAAWAIWLRDELTGDYRPERWYGLPAGERPVAAFTPSLPPERADPIEILGPLPGTSAGARTVIQAMTAAGETVGLITLSGPAGFLDPATRRLLPALAEESACTLIRLFALDDERQRTETMETANRLAGMAAGHAHDHAAALAALAPVLRETLRCDSVHLEWVEGDDLRLVLPVSDPLFLCAPPRIPLARTRASEATPGRSLREPVAGRRPEDVVLAAAAIRHVAVAPLRGAGRAGTLQVGRRDARPFTASEGSLLQMLAERLGLVFDAVGGPAAASPPVPQEVRA